MYLNQFSVRVIGGTEVSGGYVEVPHGRQYQLALGNHHLVEADAEVSIDGHVIGTFRVLSGRIIVLERKPDDHGRFTFYATGSQEGRQIGVERGKETNGLIAVTFTPAKRRYDARPLGNYQPPWDFHPFVPWWLLPPRWVYNNETVYGGGTRLPLSDASPMYTAGDGASVASAASAMHGSGEGATGLSGHSDQRFREVHPLDYDEGQRTTITLRLVIPAQDQAPEAPRPLVHYANPVPPPLSAPVPAAT